MSAWEKQALPVLRALAEPQDHHLKDGVLFVGPAERGRETLGVDIEEGELFEVLFQLRDLGYVEFSDPMYESGPGAAFSDLRITGRGLQVLGEWPRFEAMVSPATIAEVVERLAEFAPDDDQRSRLQRVAGYLRSKSKGTVKATAITLGAQSVRAVLGLP
jgi:hypothetical protein